MRKFFGLLRNTRKTAAVSSGRAQNCRVFPFSWRRAPAPFALFLISSGVLLSPGQEPSPATLADRVLVVYNANSDQSHKVAKYYMEKRNIPKQNLCKIDTEVETLEDGSLLEPEVKRPIRACLEKAGKAKILYIVFSFETPFVVNINQHQLAVDAVIADIWDEYAGPQATGFSVGEQPYFGQAESQGNVYQPFVPFEKYRAQANAKTIYSVWRLDGSNAEVAKGLVDKALEAEQKGLHGNAYFDIRGPIDGFVDKGYGAGEWDIYRAGRMAQKAGFNVTIDDKGTEFGTAPSQLRCENAALYAGWYSLGHYNDAFSWVPGAIGFHLDSASAISTRGGPSWVAGALQRGITITSGAVGEPYLEGLVHPDQIFRDLFEGGNVGDAVLRGTRWLKWMIVNLGDPLYRPFPNGIGAFGRNKPPGTWFGVSPTTVVGHGVVRGQFFLSEMRDKPLPVVFKSNYPALIKLPDNVTIPPNATGAQLQIPVKASNEPVSIVVTITAGDETISNTINVYPVIGEMTLSQSSVKSNGTVKATITSSLPALGPGFVIQLSSNQPNVVVPGEIRIPSGATQATFTVQAKTITAEGKATITAKVEDGTKSVELNLTP